MTDRDALYAAICANPDEDTPRLAFADYLDEQGGKENTTRAAYIRAAIRYAREETWTKAWRELRDQTQRVENRYRDRAQKQNLPWVTHLKGRIIAWEFDRGFIGHVTVYAKRFVAEGQKFFEQDPICSVKFAKLTARQGSVPPAELFACPHLGRATKLDFNSSGLKDKDLERLAASRHVARLRTLGLGGDNPFSKAALPNLLKKLPALSEVQCEWNHHFTDTHAKALAVCPDFARVAALDLNRAALSATGIAAIASSKYAAGLTELNLAPELDDDPYADNPHPRQSPRPTRKEGVAIAEAIAASKSLGALRALDLRGRLIGNDGLKLLAESKALPRLRVLRLGGNALGLPGVKALAASPLGPQLLCLELDSNEGLRDDADALPEMFPNAEVEVPWYYDD
jgi:uncharacterized protein (TIGR02996 family)